MEDVLQVRTEYRMRQWAEIIQDCKSSGLSNKEYCREKGISEKTFYYWLRKLRTAEEVSPQIIELPAQAQSEEKLYIRYRGAELTLPAKTDIDAIAAVLRSLQQI